MQAWAEDAELLRVHLGCSLSTHSMPCFKSTSRPTACEVVVEYKKVGLRICPSGWSPATHMHPANLNPMCAQPLGYHRSFFRVEAARHTGEYRFTDVVFKPCAPAALMVEIRRVFTFCGTAHT